MTVTPPADPAGTTKRSRLDDVGFRRRIAIVVAAATIPLAVIAAGAMTYRAGSDPEGTPPARASSATTSTVAGTLDDAVLLVPDGDYQVLCTRLRADLADVGLQPDVAQTYQLIADADLSAWITEAPPVFRPTLRRLLEARGEADAILSGAPDITKIDQATQDRLPPTFLADVLAVSVLIATECQGP